MRDDILEKLRNKEEICWINPDKEEVLPRQKVNGYGFVHMKAAQTRLIRFMPYIAAKFPETADRKGIIESELVDIKEIKNWLNDRGAGIEGRVLLKKDSHLAIAGSVKARGGIHEVLKLAETLALNNELMNVTDNHICFDSEEFKELFSRYTVHVGSTGNLGISIGIMASTLGFKAVVHMSRDAKEWKKELLRSKGVEVREYSDDYGTAVRAGREEAEKDDNSYFVDDENSIDLFAGYSTAAMRLSVQLHNAGIPVDEEHPLFVYLPCGVGGAPGGITFGLKQMFGDNVHCFFVEPTAAPCMLLGMATDKHGDISVDEIGLDGVTVADGLAVKRPSAFVGELMKPLLSGIFTVADEELLVYLKEIYEREGIFLEPSACAGLKALEALNRAAESITYLNRHDLEKYKKNATHIVWATGGALVPEAERQKLLK